MINMLEMIKGKIQQDTSGCFKPFGGRWDTLWVQLKETEKKGISQCSPGRGDKTLVDGWMCKQPTYISVYVAFCLFSPFIIGWGKISPNRERYLCTALFNLCVPYQIYTPLQRLWMFLLSMNVIGNWGYSALQAILSIAYTKQDMPSKNDLTLDASYLKWLGIKIFLSPFMIRKNFSQYTFSEGLECKGNSLQNLCHEVSLFRQLTHDNFKDGVFVFLSVSPLTVLSIMNSYYCILSFYNLSESYLLLRILLSQDISN